MINHAWAPWWKGRRGEWYVAGQIALIGLVFFGPRHVSSWPSWPAWLQAPTRILGSALLLAGAGLLVSGLLTLGRSLTPLPHPRADGTLRRNGPYAVVRHPMYAGGVLMAYGWGFVVHGVLTLLYATLLLVFADIKASREERWLLAAYPDYAEYRKGVSKLIPFVR